MGTGEHSHIDFRQGVRGIDWYRTGAESPGRGRHPRLRAPSQAQQRLVGQRRQASGGRRIVILMLDLKADRFALVQTTTRLDAINLCRNVVDLRPSRISDGGFLRAPNHRRPRQCHRCRRLPRTGMPHQILMLDGESSANRRWDRRQQCPANRRHPEG
ncbi:hypothetical protein M3O48_05825 [Xanthomonas nasturtii]|nr:hypothetical protein [Xanthomonas nasturtii]